MTIFCYVQLTFLNIKFYLTRFFAICFQIPAGAEGTVPSKVFKKVAIVENFFDIIHAVHVDLEGRPGKHAGQKRTYRTVC